MSTTNASSGGAAQALTRAHAAPNKHYQGRVYKKGGTLENREVLIEKPFTSMQSALAWITPYIDDGFQFDIWLPGYEARRKENDKATGSAS